MMVGDTLADAANSLVVVDGYSDCQRLIHLQQGVHATQHGAVS